MANRTKRDKIKGKIRHNKPKMFKTYLNIKLNVIWSQTCRKKRKYQQIKIKNSIFISEPLTLNKFKEPNRNNLDNK